jgi:heme A synthase
MLLAPSALTCSLVLILGVVAPAAVVAASSASEPLASRVLAAPDLPVGAGLQSCSSDIPRSPGLEPRSEARPRPLVPLYVAFAVLQGLDGATTVRALGRGAVEANPLLGGVAGNPAALFAAKAGTAVGSILLTERLWKRNRVAAIALMVALNGAYAAVVAHNYRVGG